MNDVPVRPEAGRIRLLIGGVCAAGLAVAGAVLPFGYTANGDGSGQPTNVSCTSP